MIGSNSTNVISDSTLSSVGWFAIRVKSNRDQVVTAGLADRGYETFLPKCRRGHGSDESARKLNPLFPGYVFSRFDITRRLPILMIPGVVHIVGIGRTPVAIPDDEIESIRLLVESDLPIAAEQYFQTGEAVRLDAGPLKGAMGTVTDRRRGLFVVSITLLQRSISVALSPEWLSKVEHGPPSLMNRHVRAVGQDWSPEEGTCR